MFRFIKSLFPNKATWNKWQPNARIGYIGAILVVLTTIVGITTGILSLGKKIIEIRPEQIFHEESSFKILIIPLEESYGTGGLNVGSVLKDRLDEIKRQDSLNIEVFYLEKFVPSGNFNEDSAIALMENYGSNMVIFGNYFFKKQLGENDEVSLNYYTNSEFINLNSFSYDPINTSDTDLRKGHLQEEIDYCIYYFTAASMFHLKDYERCIAYLNKIEIDNFKTSTYLLKIASFSYLSKIDSVRFYSNLFVKNFPEEAYSYLTILMSSLISPDSIDYELYINKILTLKKWNSVEFNILLVSFYLAMEDSINAMQLLNQLILNNPKNSNYYKLRASLNSVNEIMRDCVLNDLEMAIKYDSTGLSYCTRAEYYRDIDSIQKAIEDFTKCIEYGYGTYSLLERAKLYYKIIEYKKALKDINKFLKKDNLPGDALIEAYYLRADIYEKFENDVKVRKDWEKIDELKKKKDAEYQKLH